MGSNDYDDEIHLGEGDPAIADKFEDAITAFREARRAWAARTIATAEPKPVPAKAELHLVKKRRRAG